MFFLRCCRMLLHCFNSGTPAASLLFNKVHRWQVALKMSWLPKRILTNDCMIVQLCGWWMSSLSWAWCRPCKQYWSSQTQSLLPAPSLTRQPTTHTYKHTHSADHTWLHSNTDMRLCNLKEAVNRQPVVKLPSNFFSLFDSFKNLKALDKNLVDVNAQAIENIYLPVSMYMLLHYPYSSGYTYANKGFGDWQLQCWFIHFLLASDSQGEYLTPQPINVQQCAAASCKLCLPECH